MGISALSSALSSLQASSVRLANTAHNVANLNTEGAPRLATDLRSDPSDGVRAETRVATDEPIDLATESIERRGAALQYGISARVVRALHETQDSVLDILA